MNIERGPRAFNPEGSEKDQDGNYTLPELEAYRKLETGSQPGQAA